MTVELKGTRKVAVISWDTSLVTGNQASIQLEGQEKRTVDNDGETNLFFPTDYSGSANVVVQGSHSGEDSGTIEIT